MLIPWALEQVWRSYATHQIGASPTPSRPRVGITRQAALELERRYAAAATGTPDVRVFIAPTGTTGPLQEITGALVPRSFRLA